MLESLIARHQMKITDIMKHDVVSISSSASIGQAVELFIAGHIGTLPVVDQANKVIGLFPMSCAIELVMPDFIGLIEDFDFVRDFGAVESRMPALETLMRPVKQVMEEPVCVEETGGLTHAFALLHRHSLSDLPVINAKGQLIGIVSRVDVGTALLSNWGGPNLATTATKDKLP
jgi:CBS-domain-containing membrane protein